MNEVPKIAYVLIAASILLALIGVSSMAVVATDGSAENLTNNTTVESSDNTENFVETDSLVEDNLVCKDISSGDPEMTDLGRLIERVVYMIVVIGAMVGVVLGAGYTMMSAIKPSESKYTEARNNAVLFGGGTIVVLYGANAIISTMHESLDFSCVLPYL